MILNLIRLLYFTCEKWQILSKSNYKHTLKVNINKRFAFFFACNRDSNNYKNKHSAALIYFENVFNFDWAISLNAFWIQCSSAYLQIHRICMYISRKLGNTYFFNLVQVILAISVSETITIRVSAIEYVCFANISGANSK